MDQRLQQAMQEQEQRRQARQIDVAQLSDEEIELRGNQAKETTETQLRQGRALAQLRAKEKAEKNDAK